MRRCASFSKVKEIILVLIECASPYRPRAISDIIPEILTSEASSIHTLSLVLVCLDPELLKPKERLVVLVRLQYNSIGHFSAVVRSIPVGLRNRGSYILRSGLQRKLTLCKEGSVFLPDIFNLYSKAIV